MREFHVLYEKTEPPKPTPADTPVDLTEETMAEHKKKILLNMARERLDVLLVYADREHGTNYGYLTGFEPRFEESILVLHKDGQAFLMLGNEMLRMAAYSRIPVQAIHTPHFSLPNQPMETELGFTKLLEKAGIRSFMQVGIAGWKLFTGKMENNDKMFDVPSFIVESIRGIIGVEGRIRNATGLFIHPEHGARIQVNANEAAHYEFGASLAGECVNKVLNEVTEGKTELELAEFLSAYGQPLSVQTICAGGQRFTNAVVSPRKKKVMVGERLSVTMGLRGGLTCRTAYLVEECSQLPEKEKDYLEQAAEPYFRALAVWFSEVGLGKSAGELYSEIEQVIPKSRYGWELNPGHYTAGEEWMSSPFWEGSEIILKSGMMLQMDIIIRVPGYGGANAEDGILLADARLREEIKEQYPQVWDRMMIRQRYMREVLGIPIGEEVLPMSGICGYYRPYVLRKDFAFKIKVTS